MGKENNFILKLAQPAQRALKQAGLSNIKDFAKITEEDLMQLHGVGVKAIDVIRNALKESGLAFKARPGNQGKKRTNS